MADPDGGLVDRHGLWTASQYEAEENLLHQVDSAAVDMVRFVFADQHGILRGKSVSRASLPKMLRSGIAVPSSLLLKDTSGRSVFSVFSADPGVGVGGMAGASDIVLVPDPTTFVHLPWARRAGLVLCDVHFPTGETVPFCTRSLLRRALGSVEELGYRLTVGPELEFHLFRDASPEVTAARIGQPGAPGAAPLVEPTTSGSQLLHIETLDGFDEVLAAVYDGLTGMGLSLRTLELEFGPSQLELTLEADDAPAAADAVVLCRAAVRQICARHGYRATFMSRPVGAETASTGWHLHQSLTGRDTGENAFVPTADDEVLSPLGRSYLAGLLEHADAATAFSTPTVNGYKRYRPFSLAPDRRVWGVDNKGAMIRAIGRVGDSASRLENRSGEPGANPYLYVMSQVVAGLDGVARDLDPGPPTLDPYAADAPRLPGSLESALDALDASSLFRDAVGDTVVDWYLGLKRAEYGRYLAHVSDWEQREYLGIL